MNAKEYRDWLISGILEYQEKAKYTEEELRKKPTRRLEQIYDTIE